jgi:hypothetical protein
MLKWYMLSLGIRAFPATLPFFVFLTAFLFLFSRSYWQGEGQAQSRRVAVDFVFSDLHTARIY